LLNKKKHSKGPKCYVVCTALSMGILKDAYKYMLGGFIINES